MIIKNSFFSEIFFVPIKIHSNTNGCNFHVRTETFFGTLNANGILFHKLCFGKCNK